MSGAPGPSREVTVILDPDFGEEVRHVAARGAVWIAMSPSNKAVVQAIWAEARARGPQTTITGFVHSETNSAEDQLLAELYAIDLHHGPYSTDAPYTVLNVIGAEVAEARQGSAVGAGLYRVRATRQWIRRDAQRRRSATTARLISRDGAAARGCGRSSGSRSGRWRWSGMPEASGGH